MTLTVSLFFIGYEKLFQIVAYLGTTKSFGGQPEITAWLCVCVWDTGDD